MNEPIFSMLTGKPGFIGAGYYLSTQGVTISGSTGQPQLNATYRLIEEYNSSGQPVAFVGGPSGGSVYYAKFVNGANDWSDTIEKMQGYWQLGSFGFFNYNTSTNTPPTTGWVEYCPELPDCPAASITVSAVSFNDIVPDYIF